MKKIIALVAVAAISVSMVCAQITVGAKGNFGMNLGSQLDNKFDGAKDVFMVNGGGSIYGRYNMPFLPELGVQLEFGLTANNGAGQKVGGISQKSSYLSLDFPLLVTYDIPVSSIVITPMVGMNFSIPVGKIEVSMFEAYAKGFIPGLVAGVEVGIPVGPGSVTAGLSYVNDFIPVKAKYLIFEGDVLTRRNLNLSAGYAIKL